MITTITEETYYQGTEQKTGKLYTNVKQVNFCNSDNTIVIYHEIGSIETKTDEIAGDYTVHVQLKNNAIAYTQNEMKTLIDATGRNFNADSTNLMLDEINQYVDDILLAEITSNPQNYFGLTVNKWEKA